LGSPNCKLSQKAFDLVSSIYLWLWARLRTGGQRKFSIWSFYSSPFCYFMLFIYLFIYLREGENGRSSKLSTQNKGRLLFFYHFGY